SRLGARLARRPGVGAAASPASSAPLRGRALRPLGRFRARIRRAVGRRRVLAALVAVVGAALARASALAPFAVAATLAPVAIAPAFALWPRGRRRQLFERRGVEGGDGDLSADIGLDVRQRDDVVLAAEAEDR